jgi:hypothetical protein
MSPEIEVTLDEAVEEVLGFLTGMDLTYNPRYDRYRTIARAVNRALRANALEKEWSYYHDYVEIPAVSGERSFEISADETQRVRIINDDAVVVVDSDGNPAVWAYFLPRDALHKYQYRDGWWVSVTRNILTFNRELNDAFAGYLIKVPVMREPTMFVLPVAPEDPDDPIVEIDPAVRTQVIDFAYPDVIWMRAAYYIAQSDPVMQPRAQTVEAQYKDLMYQAIERDDRFTDSPLQNDFAVPVQNDIYRETSVRPWPMADRRR